MRQRDASSQYRRTFAEVCEESRHRATTSLFARAAIASRLAKGTKGRARQLLYGIKNECLWHLIRRGQVLGGVDHVRAPGLLSAHLPGGGKLHTHENWLAAAATPAA